MELKKRQIDPTSNSDEEGGNAGWADSIAKILKTNKPKKKKYLVLSRAKKLQQVKKEKKTYDFEIDGEIKEEKPYKEALEEKVKIKKEKQKLLLRVKPSIKDRDRDRVLKKIATKGVVQLFNAVRIQQKAIQSQIKQAGPLDHKKDAVLNNINKRKFLDVLMGGQRAKSEAVDNPIKDETVKNESDISEDDEAVKDEKFQWSVLRDDFMTNKKLRNWDKADSDTDGNDKLSNSSKDIYSEDE